MNIHLFPIASIALAGLIFGSFLNVCIYRLPRNISLWHPRRSFCPTCTQKIAWWQNIPLLSYILLRGRCGNCNVPVSRRYPLVESLTPILAICLYWRFGLQPETVFYTILFWILLVISFIDAEFQRIPNLLLMILLGAGSLFNIVWPIFAYETLVTGLLYGFTLLWVIRALGNVLTGVESMGWGDVKLYAVLGFYLGWQGLTATLFFASLLAVIYYYGRLFLQGKTARRIPFAPFLSFGAFIVVLGGDVLWEVYIEALKH